METINLYDKLGITSIEKRNEFRFKDIKNLIDACGDSDVELNLRYIKILEKGSEFSDIITDKRTHFVVYNDDELYEYIKFIATVSGINPDDKVRHVVNKVTVERVRVDESERYYNVFKEMLEESGNSTLAIGQRFSIMGSYYMVKGLLRVLEENKDKHITVDVNGVSIADAQIAELSEGVYKLLENGYNIDVLTSNARLKNTIETIMNTCNSGVETAEDKYNLLMKSFPIGTAGILSTFSSRADNRDPLGRGNNGNPVSSLPAILVGYNSECAEFIVYKYNTFQKKSDWEEEHDGEKHPGIMSEKKRVKLTELGICGYCVGKKYQFNIPIQFGKEGLQRTYGYDPVSNMWVTKFVPIASYMMMVFNDWGIKYNSELLMDAIRISKRNLDNAGIKYSKN